MPPKTGRARPRVRSGRKAVAAPVPLERMRSGGSAPSRLPAAGEGGELGRGSGFKGAAAP